jgi:hypothetical protein
LVRIEEDHIHPPLDHQRAVLLPMARGVAEVAEAIPVGIGLLSTEDC